MKTEAKNPRGRPPVLSKPVYEMLKKIYFEQVQTRRSLLNKYYENKAFGIIEDLQHNGESGLEYLVDSKIPKCRWGVLRELGKFSPEEVAGLARFVCQHGPEHAVREWELILRKCRLSETVSENSELTE